MSSWREVNDLDDDSWQDMPVILPEDNALDFDDRKRFKWNSGASDWHLRASETEPSSPTSPTLGTNAGNATGRLLDIDAVGQEWREKEKLDEMDYTRLELDDDPEEDEISMRTQYLFNEDKGMTPLSQMQATKTLLTEGQRIAYVGLCRLVAREMIQTLALAAKGAKELEPARESAKNWASKIMGRLYRHMEVNAAEQRMIEQLADHGVTAEDLVPSLATTHTIDNPEYDPDFVPSADLSQDDDVESLPPEPTVESDLPPAVANSPTATPSLPSGSPTSAVPELPSTPETDHFASALPSSLPGVSKTLTAADKTVTLDIRWTILCDLFLSLIADSVYDARSRVLLGKVADRLGLGWMDVVRFERRLTEALEIQESIKAKEHSEVLESQRLKGQRQRYVMMGLATLGGGLVIGLSAGLLAPVIGAGLGAALTTVGVTGTTGFLAGAGGAAIISSGATLTGSVIGGKAMAKRTRHVKTFEFQPLHNNKRVNFFITVPGFMNGALDDVRLPFSTIDPVMGDVFSVLWEPDMMGDTGNALKILTSEVLTQAGQQVLAMTVMTALLSALQWPIMLTKLSYLIDNPWSNALDRARQAGAVLADILINRRMGVRPVSLVGFSLGARVIFYALVELAKANAFGVVQEVYLFGATLTASKKVWRQVRGLVAGRFVNAFAMNDWVLGYLFRATSGGLQTVAGLRPIEHVPDLENVDITDILVGHMSYRTLMPTLLAHVGFKTTADHFDEPDEMEVDAPDREVLTPEEEARRLAKKERGSGIAGFFKSKRKGQNGSAPMSRNASSDYDLPPRLSTGSASSLPDGAVDGRQLNQSSLSVATSASHEEAVGEESDLDGAPQEQPIPEPPPREAEAPPEPPSEASVPVGFNFDKIREEVAALAQAKPVKPESPSASSLPPADLSNLEVTLDPHDILRRKWSGEALTPTRPTVPLESVDDWAPPPQSLSSETSMTFNDAEDATPPAIAFGGEDGTWKPSSFGDTPDAAPTFVWGRVNESTTSLRPQNPW